MLTQVSKWRQLRFKHWLNQRIPAANSLSLNKRNIFIFPSWAGLAYLAVSLAIFILATNYESNLSLLLCYWLLALFLILLYLSYFNLSGMALSASPLKPVHVGDRLQLEVSLQSNKKHFHLNWLDEVNTQIKQTSPGREIIKLSWNAKRRGNWVLPRVKLFSQAPSGLFNVWTYPDFNQQVLIYPKLIACPEYAFGTGKNTTKEGDLNQPLQGVDFQGLKNYQKGDSLSRVAWKRASFSQNWQIKHFEQTQDQQIWFSIYKVQADSIEEKLSKLAWLVTNAHHQEITYGLQLSHIELDPAQGESHLKMCLEQLAKHP